MAVAEFTQLVEQRRPDMEAALGSMLADDKKRFLMLAIRGVQNHEHKDGKQCHCTADSMVQCVIDACLMGLEVGTAIQHAYLIPYGNVLTLRPSYMGLIYRAVQAGVCDHIYAELVRATDKVEVDGVNRKIKHDFEPFKSNKERGPVVGVYAVAILANGIRDFEALNADDVAAIRRKAAPGSKAWDEFEGEMWKKSAMRRLIKRLQGSRAITGDDERKLAAALEANDKEFDVETTGTRVEAGQTTLDKVADEIPANEPPKDPPVSAEQLDEIQLTMANLGVRMKDIPALLEQIAGCPLGEIRVSQLHPLALAVAPACEKYVKEKKSAA